MVASMTFNQFQKELTNRGIDRQVAYMLSVLFEAQVEQGKQLDACANILTDLVRTVEQFASLHEATQGKMQQLVKDMTGETEGVFVSTEPGSGRDN